MAADVDIKSLLLLSAILAMLAGCQATGSKKTPERYIASYQDIEPTIERFEVCHDIHCEGRTTVQMDSASWQHLNEQFAGGSSSAAREREQIRSAIGLFEEIVGPIAGTSGDKPRNATGPWGDRQLDCIAETVNTTTYLLLFREQGWLQWHDVALPRHRGFFTGHWPHNAAVIREKQSGEEYVIDSFFYKNGVPPVIVPARSWQAGYDPDDE